MTDTTGYASKLTDGELYVEYQQAKREGPVGRIDDLQLEIASRWEAQAKERDVLRVESDGPIHEVVQNGDVLFSHDAASGDSALYRPGEEDPFVILEADRDD